MSFINPVKVPVKVYLSTDKDAPRLDRTANCVQTIFKACLVTGYGEKEGAGWSMPFEDTTKGIKVFRPEVSPETDFYLKLSADTGREVKAEVYQNMTAIDNGDKRLECATPFKYGIQNATSGKWAVIACGRAFWFFHETANKVNATQSGVYFYCGDTGKNTIGERAIFLKHTGGVWGYGDADRYSILNSKFSDGGNPYARVFNPKNLIAHNVIPTSQFGGSANESKNTLLSPVLVMADNEVWALPAYSPSTVTSQNYDVIEAVGRTFINHSTATYSPHNFFVPTDYWEF